MKKKTILALGNMGAPIMAEVEKHFDLIRLWKESDPEETLRVHRADIVGILSTYNGLPVTRKILESLPNVEIICQYGAGFDNVDVEAAKDRGVIVTNTPDIPTADTADTAMALMLNVCRRFVESDVFVRVGKWHSGAFPPGTALRRKTVGIVGMGRIGQAIARRAAAFDMNIIYHGPREKPDVPYPYYADLPQMAQACDILILACRGGPETHHLVGGKVLNALGPKGFLVNIARGTVVNTEDLLVALSNRDIAGAGLDVYEDEPNVPEALLSMDNVVLLPHIGGNTNETKAEMGDLVLANLMAHFEGRPLPTPLILP
jgi:hydroxypyruvate reductase